MPYNVGLKQNMARFGIGRPTVGGGGPFINPRAPGNRLGLMIQPPAPQMFGRRSMIQAGVFNVGRGDPGFFGAIGKFVGGVAKTVGKAAVGAIGGAIKATPLGGAVMNVIGGARIGAPAPRSITGQTNPMVIPTNPFGEPEVPVITTGGGGTVTPGTSVALCAPSGYHLNKSGYWKSDSDLLPGASWHPKGTVLVKNRRQNPFNPRAASRAMARLGGLYRAMKVLDKQMSKVARGAGVRSHGSRSQGKHCKCSARK